MIASEATSEGLKGGSTGVNKAEASQRQRRGRGKAGVAGTGKEEKPKGALHIVLHNIVSVLTTEQAPKLGRFVHAIRSRPTINPGFDDSHSFMLSKLTGAKQEGASDVNT